METLDKPTLGTTKKKSLKAERMVLKLGINYGDELEGSYDSVFLTLQNYVNGNPNLLATTDGRKGIRRYETVKRFRNDATMYDFYDLLRLFEDNAVLRHSAMRTAMNHVKTLDKRNYARLYWVLRGKSTNLSRMSAAQTMCFLIDVLHWLAIEEQELYKKPNEVS